ncbi:MAG: YbjN domain-containing protein [bacterium]|nr:YbjN domain-containing protein [bacterium]
MTHNEPSFTFNGNTIPTFQKTLLGSVRRPILPEKWDKVLDLFDEGKYKESLLALLDYADDTILSEKSNPDHSEFVIPHGSIVVKIFIEKESFRVEAPFLQLPDKNPVPLLRQAAQLNLHPLNLAELVLEKDVLTFEYQCPLALCNPFKIYDLLQEICRYADAYDDQFIKQFDAKWIHKPVIKTFQPKFLDLARDRTQFYVKEALAYVDYFESQRNPNFGLAILIITVLKIDYDIEPQGLLKTEIENIFSFLNREDISLPELVARGKEFMRKLQDYDKTRFQQYLYVADTFISMRNNFTSDMVETYFRSSYESTKKEIAARQYSSAALYVQSICLELFFNNVIPENLKSILTDGLIKSSRQPWDKAASTMLNCLEQALDIKKSKGKKGFWGSLFGG